MANHALYGFENLTSRMSERVTTIGVDDVLDAINQSLEEHNRQLNALVGLFAETTTDFQTQYRTPVHYRLQPLDENGRAEPIRRAGAYTCAWPLKQAGLARGENYVTGVKTTLAELAMDIAAIEEADARWMRDQILAALFNNVTWTYPDDLHGDLSIQPLANGDAVTYNLRTGDDIPATDNHYLAQAEAISDTNNPFETAWEELMEHPENAGAEVIALVPYNLRSSIRALTDYYDAPDANINYGNDTALLGAFPNIAVPGEMLGYVGGGRTKVWVCEWRSLPNNYIIHVAVGAPAGKPLRMRQHEEAELQGFKMVATREDYPYSESQWLRFAGFGGWARVSATVTLIGSGSYVIPPGYAEPVP